MGYNPPCEPTPITQLPGLSDDLGFAVVLKREDMSCVGSHKFRPIGYQLEMAAAEHKPVVISTSGNAGIALAELAPRYKVPAIVVVDPRIEEEKLSHIVPSDYVHVFSSEDAIRMANYISAAFGAVNLRPSKNDDALTGYMSLGEEILSDVPDVAAVFSYVTSGASFLGMDRILNKDAALVAMHAVQSGGIRSLGQRTSDVGTAGGTLGIQKTRRAASIINVIDRTNGHAWYVLDDDIQAVGSILRKHDVITSFEGIATVAAAQKAHGEGMVYDGSVVAVLSGAHRESQKRTWEPVFLTSFDDAKQKISSIL